MGVFAYQALDGRQRPVSGTVAADSPALARQLLRTQGLLVERVEPVVDDSASMSRRIAAWLTRSRAGAERVAELWRGLAMLLRADVPLVEALAVARKQQPRSLDRVLRQVEEAVRQGRTFSDALSAHAHLVSPLGRVMLRVGEQSGALDGALLQVADLATRQRATANRLITALIYPAILVVVGLAVVVFLMSNVVPQLVEVLVSAGRPLPAPTRVLKAIADGLIANGPLLCLACAALVAATIVARTNTALLRRIQRMTLMLPLWGGLVRKAWVARVSDLLSAMLKVDVRFTEALRVVESHLPHVVFAESLARLRQALERGAGIAESLDEKVIPPLVAHLLRVGQESGELSQMLEQIRDHYDREVQLALSRFLAVLEPALILVLAIVIGFVVYAVLLPILETTKVVQ